MWIVPVVQPLALTHLAAQTGLFVERREKTSLFLLSPEEKRGHLSFVWFNLFIIVFCIRKRNFMFRYREEWQSFGETVCGLRGLDFQSCFADNSVVFSDARNCLEATRDSSTTVLAACVGTLLFQLLEKSFLTCNWE